MREHVLSKKYVAASLVKAIILSYVATAILLMLLALAMYKLGISTKTVGFGITFVYIFAPALGGLYIGRKVKQKKFLWGVLLGVLYAAVIFVVSLILKDGNSQLVQDAVSTAMLCICGGLIGGMISP